MGKSNRKWTDQKTGLTRNLYVGNEFDPLSRENIGKAIWGRTNIERMKKGLNPMGYDGKPLNMHHIMNNSSGDLMYLSDTAHKQYSALLHSSCGYNNLENPIYHDNSWVRIRRAVNRFLAEVLENGKLK